MSQTHPQESIPTATEPSTEQMRLDPAKFEAYAKATRKAVAEELALRALMAQTPPSKARH